MWRRVRADAESEEMSVYDAAVKYQEEKVPLVDYFGEIVKRRPDDWDALSERGWEQARGLGLERVRSFTQHHHVVRQVKPTCFCQ